MESPEKFLREKYPDLPGSKPVERAVKNKLAKGEKGPQTKEDRIQSYLDRLERLVLDPQKEQSREILSGESRPRALSILREMVMNKYIRSNKEKLAEGAARVEERAARELGIEAHYGEEELEQRGEIAIEDLEKSLDNWITYLSDNNEPYPVWFRYYVFRNILNLGDYDKDKKEFTKRSEGSTRLFPEIDRGALAYVEELVEASKDPAMLEKLQKAQIATQTPEDQLITQEKALNFSKFSFAKQYAEGIKLAGEITKEMREETQGKWVKYQKGTDPTALWASLQNKGTAWCTKGFGTAETQLKGGDFYVYYTNDNQGNLAIPRIAIRMQEDSIGEVRGVADNDQNLEGNMAPIAEAKMKELPGAERYKKASTDMKQLTYIEKKVKSNQELTKDDLTFLYELDSKIEGFGYRRDPRIEKLRKERNPEEDMLIILEYTKDQIAHNSNEINENTKVYLGKLEPGIFDLIQKYNLEHVYTTFPEDKLRFEDLTIGGRTKEELEKEFKKQGMKIFEYAQDMLNSKDFTTSKTKEELKLVRLKVKDLGFTSSATTDEIYKKAKKLGLELCPAEVGPNLRLKYTNQPFNEWFLIAMKQISGRLGNPHVFYLQRLAGGLWLSVDWARPGDGWDPGDEVLFRLR